MRFYVKTAVAGALALAIMGGSLVSQAKKSTETKMPGMDRSTTLELRVPRPYDRSTETRIEQELFPDRMPDEDTWLEGQLTVEEKAQLERTKAKTAPLYKEMDEIEAEISKITERILGKYKNGEEQLNALYARHNKLWEKLDNHSTEKEWELSAEDRIRASKSLSESEKETLLQDLDDIDELEAILKEKNREISEETEDLEAELDELYDEIAELEKQDKAIWERIYGPSPIPYNVGK